MPKVTFPKIGSKHAFPSFINPEQVQERARRLNPPKRAIFIYSGKLESTLKRELKLQKYDELLKHIGNANCFYKSEISKDILVVKLAIGAPLTAVVAEELIAIGVKEILIMGSAGSLTTGHSFGELLLCVKAVRDEGTSHHYLKNSLYVESSKKLAGKLEAIAGRSKIKLTKCTTWTIDAPYRETIKEAEHYKKLGVSTVEMEAAALFAVAKVRKIDAAAIFTISDILKLDAWSGFALEGKKIQQKYAYPRMVEIAKHFAIGK